MSSLSSSLPKRLLVLRFGALGDILLTTPALEAIRRVSPSTEIIYVVKKQYAALIENHPAVTQVISFKSGESLFTLAKRLRALKADACLDLHGKMRSRALFWLLPFSVKKIRWKKRPLRDNLPVRLGLRPYVAQQTISSRFVDAAQRLFLGRQPLLAVGSLSYQPSACAIKEAEEHLSPHFREWIGISPGAAWETKRWPTKHMVKLAQYCIDAGYSLVFTGSKSEIHLVEEIVSLLNPPAVETQKILNLAGKGSIDELGGIISKCRVFVANDSGPMHMARALGVPTLAFFGSTDPKQFLFQGHALMWNKTPCAPCHFYGRKTCPQKHFQCLQGISPEQAIVSLNKLLAGAQRVRLVAG